ncbi:MAG: DNA (cytosine-5-)-methyltransferase [Bacteriovoracaceae bacterium]|nr:DNA (cytosine-5-)-methyltransferase [Bacteriovoracaceae bacterium]
MQKLKAISLFCGCGGADLGVIGGFEYLGKKYPKTGIKIVHASDIDKYCIETYNENFEHKAEVEDIRMLDFELNESDIVLGGFPCQSFSTLNPTKNPDSKQGQLFWEMARVVNQVKPKIFIAENVKGFYTLNEGKYFKMAKKKFESVGYRVYFKILKATDYGIPQKRERLIMVGVRNDLKGEFKFPLETHGINSKNKSELVTLRSVIEKLKIDNPKYYFSKKAVEGVKNAKPNMKRALAQDLDKPCLTVTSHLAKVSIYSRDPILLVSPKDELYRRFTPREAARIQSFPDSFKFSVSETQAYKQIGNAIPPVLMWHVIKEVCKLIEANKKITADKMV